MRMLLKATIPTEAGNAGLKDGSLPEGLSSIMEDTKPEAVYFYVENGLRTCFMVFDMDDQSQLPSVVEPWFLGMGAQTILTPVMNGEDFEKAGPSIGGTIEKYG